MTKNPHPKMIDCDSTGQSVGNPLYTVWNQAWAAGWNDHAASQAGSKYPSKNRDGPKKKMT